MTTVHDGETHVPPSAQVPPRVQQAAIEGVLSAELADIRRVGERRTKAEEVTEEYTKRLRHQIGSEKYDRFRSFVGEQRRLQAGHMLPPRGPRLPLKEADRLRMQARESSLTALRELGIELGNLKQVTKAAVEQLSKLVPPFPEYEGKPVVLVLPGDVPAAIRDRKTNPWTYVAAPYAGSAWSYMGYLGGFMWTPGSYQDASAGLVGNNNGLTDASAGNFDIGEMEYNTAVGFWYRMPAAGLIEVWIEAQSAASHHHVTLYDELGWSDSFCYQRDYLTLRTFGTIQQDEQKESLMSWLDVDGYTSGNWDRHYLSDGATYWAHLFSAVAYPVGQWVYIRVGTRTYNKCFANDVSVYSTVHFRWFIRSVWVDSTGA